MRKGNPDLRYLIAVISTIMTLGFFNPAWAIPPEIYSITPDSGIDTIQTHVTITGTGFQQTPRVSLYGGGPYITGTCDTPGLAWDVYVTGAYAYVADSISGLQVIDISDPNNPSIIGTCDTPGSAYGVYVTDTYVYVADEGSGLQVIEKFSSLTNIYYIDSNTLTATVPAGYSTGTYNLHVTNPDGGHAVLKNAFSVYHNYYKDSDIDGYGDARRLYCGIQCTVWIRFG